MTIEEIKALMSAELEEGAEDNRLDQVYGEITERDAKVEELTAQVSEMTEKIAGLVETNAKLVEQLKYVEPEKEEEEEKEPETIFEDLSSFYEED